MRRTAGTLIIGSILLLFGWQAWSESSEKTSELGGCKSLEVRDHTNIMLSFQDHIGYVVRLSKARKIDVLDRSPKKGVTVIHAITGANYPDKETFQRILLVEACLSVISSVEVPKESRRAIRAISVELGKAFTVDEVLEILNNAGRNQKYAGGEDVVNATYVASEVVEDGLENGIYDPSGPLFQQLERGGVENPLVDAKTASEHATELAIADAMGALNGALGGCAAGLLAAGVGCPAGGIAGGVAGAVGNSATELIEMAWKYFYPN